jgi:hypothetical protein
MVRNGVGFSKPDALTFAGPGETLEGGGHLSPEQLRTCRSVMRNGTPRIAKYRRQLMLIEDGVLSDSDTGLFKGHRDDVESEVVQ